MVKKLGELISVTLSTIAHATEDLTKVEKAILELVDPRYRDNVNVEFIKLKGHWGNPIFHVKTEIRVRNIMLATVSWISSKMNSLDKRLIDLELKYHIDRDGNLYLRFNKQNAYKGSLVLDEGDDVIRVVFKVRGIKRLSEMRRIFRELGIIKGEQ